MPQPTSTPITHLLTTLLSYKPNLHPAIIHTATKLRLYPYATILTKQLISHVGPTTCITSLTSFPKCTSHVIDVIIVSLAQLNFLETASKTLLQSKHMPAVVAGNSVLHELLKCGRTECLWELYASMLSRGIQPNVFTYNILINACRYDGDVNKALSLFDEMTHFKIVPTVHTYTTLICCLCDCGDLPSAVKMFKLVKSPSLYAYNALMDGYFKNVDVEAALSLYKEIFENGLLPNEVTFGIMIDGLCKNGEVVKASRLFFVDMEEHGVSANVDIYNCLIDGFFKIGSLSQVFVVYTKMRKVGLLSDVVTYGILIKGLCNAGSVQEAVGLISVMHKEGISANIVICNSIIDGYCKQGNMEKATETCSWMNEKGIEPNIITFTLLINGHCKNGEMDAAYGVYNETVARGFEPDVVTYTSLIDGYSKVGDFEKVSKLEREMVDNDVEPNVVTNTCLIDGLCKARRTGAAIKLFLKKTAFEQFKPNAKTYMALICGLHRAGQYFKSGRFYFLMRESGLVPDVVTYILLMHGQCVFGYTLNAMMLQADMVKLGVIPEKWYISYPLVRQLFDGQTRVGPSGHFKHQSKFQQLSDLFRYTR